MKKFWLFSSLLAALLISNTTQAFSESSPTVTFGWNALDYGQPSVNSSYYIGDGSVASNGSKYQPLIESLPLCKTLIEHQIAATDCIQSLEARIGDGQWVQGRLDRYLPVHWQPHYVKVSDAASNIVEFSADEIDIPAENSKNTIAGGRGGLWSFDGISHSLGKQFVFYTDAYGVAIDGKVDWQQGFLKSNLYPVSVSDNKVVSVKNWAPLYTMDALGTCVYDPSRTFCMKPGPFPANIDFRLTLKLNRVATSINSERWFITRTINPSLSITPSADGRLFVLKGQPVVVQVPEIKLPQDRELVTSFVRSWLMTAGKVSPNIETLIQKEAEQYITGSSNGLIEPANSGGSTKIFAGWEPFLKYATIKELTGWNFTNEGGSLADYPLQLKLYGCPKSDQFPGFVASNSTTIEPGPPTFNNVDQSLEYRVAAPHLTANNSVNMGTYSLYVSPQIAQCLWGKNLLGAKATISIQSDDGSIQTTTSTFKIDSNGLAFNVSGFHYSSGAVKIRLVESAPEIKPTPATTPMAVNTSKSTILCIKGKLIKKVTAVNPSCPTGYKKK